MAWSDVGPYDHDYARVVAVAVAVAVADVAVVVVAFKNVCLLSQQHSLSQTPRAFVHVCACVHITHTSEHIITILLTLLVAGIM